MIIINQNQNYLFFGKANALDHNQPEQIDHLKPVLNACFYIYYNTLNLTGQMWSRPPVFAVYTIISREVF
jgi:hypothetical protein